MDLLTCDCPTTEGFDGIVETYADLPVDGTADVGEIWLVRENSGTWLINRKPAGLYQRINDSGDRDTDWMYLGEWLEEFSDANFSLYNAVDNSKVLAFDLSGIGTGQTRTLKIPDASGTIALTGAITGAGFTMSTGRLLGRTTASTGAIEEIAAGSGLSLAAGTLTIDSTVATLTGTQTLTNKTLTAPTIAGGTHTGIASLGIRSSGSGAFDLTLANSENLTAGRTLTIALGDAARTLTLTGNASISGTNTGDQTSVSGNAGTATKLATARNINGVAFDGSADITVAAAAGSLTGSTLASGVTGSSLTSVGTLGTGVWNATAIGVAYGGTGLSSYTVGDMLYASGTTTLAKLAAVATGQVLVSAGTGTAPAWSASPFVSSISAGVVSSQNPGGLPMYLSDQATGALQFVVETANASAVGAGMRFRKARGTLASPGNPNDNDNLAIVAGQAWVAGNSAYLSLAEIDFDVDGVVPGSGRPPSSITFYTNASAGSQLARLKINNAGRLLVGTTTDNSTGILQIAASTSSAGGIVFGNDSPVSSIYRSAASILTLTGGASFSTTTDATSATAAALTVAGGVGIAKKLWIDGGSGKTLTVTNFVANGSVATAMSSLGPAGAHTTIQKWLRVSDGSNDFFVPCF